MSNPGLMLQIDGLLGDCKNPRYYGWMDLFWFSFGGAGEFGQNRPSHLATMTMPVGRISTTLQIACLRHRRYRSASLVALNQNHTTEKFHAVMEDVKITGFQFQGYSGDMPIHSLEISYFSMEMKNPADLPDKLRGDLAAGPPARPTGIRLRTRFAKPARARHQAEPQT